MIDGFCFFILSLSYLYHDDGRNRDAARDAARDADRDADGVFLFRVSTSHGSLTLPAG